MAAELQWKPCPFCGCTDIRWNRHPGAGTGMWHSGQDVFSMCCYGCGGTVPNRYSLELLNESWNKRPTPSVAVPPHDPTSPRTTDGGAA